MNEQDLIDLVETLYPYIINKYKKEQDYNSLAKITVGTALAAPTDQGFIKVKINPYDTDDKFLFLKSRTSDSIIANDSILILYWGDIKNGIVILRNG